MEFEKYQHVERFGNTEVNGIENGHVYIQPKIDGTNGSVFLNEDGDIQAASRNRVLTLDSDNTGFFQYVVDHPEIENYLSQFDGRRRLFGEFLVPHTIKYYREDAWRKFYVFDVIDTDENGEEHYVPFDEYKEGLETYGINYVPVLFEGTNLSYLNFVDGVKDNKYLLSDEAIAQGKVGEGIVIKNYEYKNRFGRTTWAKIVASEFAEKHQHKPKGNKQIESDLIEQQIVDDFCTTAFIEKEYAKIVEEKNGWTSKYIPMLLSKVFYELINEETWHFIKKYKNPKIDFKTLNVLVTKKIKSVKSEIFG